MPTGVCLHCKKEFPVEPNRIASGRGKFCSKECSLASHWQTYACVWCGKELRRKRGRVAKSNQAYCDLVCLGNYKRKNLEDKLWPLVVKEPDNGCWIFTGFIDKSTGYGKINSSKNAGRGVKTRRLGAHQVSYELTYGPIPEGMLVCHRCDIRNCVRPDHLFLGTFLDNARDCISKDRHTRGTRHYLAQFTDQDIYDIRALQGKSPASVVADNYRSSLQSIYEIWWHKTWKHLP